MAFPPGIRAASSDAHDFVAVGGASALGSVASFGWIGPQAANIPAKPTDNLFRDPVRVSLDEPKAMNQMADIPRIRRGCGVTKRLITQKLPPNPIIGTDRQCSPAVSISAGPHGNVLKIRPPLVFGTEHADLLVETLDQVLAEVNVMSEK